MNTGDSASSECPAAVSDSLDDHRNLITGSHPWLYAFAISDGCPAAIHRFFISSAPSIGFC